MRTDFWCLSRYLEWIACAACSWVSLLLRLSLLTCQHFLALLWSIVDHYRLQTPRQCYLRVSNHKLDVLDCSLWKVTATPGLVIKYVGLQQAKQHKDHLHQNASQLSLTAPNTCYACLRKWSYIDLAHTCLSKSAWYLHLWPRTAWSAVCGVQRCRHQSKRSP